MGSADTALPSGMSSIWCSWQKTWTAKHSKAAMLSGRDMAAVRKIESIMKGACV